MNEVQFMAKPIHATELQFMPEWQIIDELTAGAVIEGRGAL